MWAFPPRWRRLLARPRPNGQQRFFWSVSDLGDGFDATYTIARLLAEPTLKISVREPS